MNKLFLIGLLCLFGLSAMSQSPSNLSWKKRAKVGDELFAKGNYANAAEYYNSVYKEKSNKLEYAYMAGECYYRIRDYENAAVCFEAVKDKNIEFHKPGYKYALCLKQQGLYKKAKREFEYFVINYGGEDYKTFETVVLNQVQGCDLALKQLKPNVAKDAKVEHLDSPINSDRTEFAPIPFDEGVLYFSSNKEGTASIYRSQQNEDSWSQRVVPSIFKEMERPHFGNGSFTPEGNRFYFTQCDIYGGESICAIYVMENKDGSWSKPIKLPDYINAPEGTTTHPYVSYIGEKEVLYFVSNREGGKGGLDIWYAMKTINSTGNNFTLPVNLGSTINTVGDEVTPQYIADDKVLHFASNGHVNIGGFDIYSSEGEKTRWTKPKNLGYPINSSADDLYYVETDDRSEGYLVSNRIAQPGKMNTLDDDIFTFSKSSIQAFVSGKVVDASSSASLTDVSISLFEIVEGESALIKERRSSDGNYEFRLKPNKVYRIETQKNGYKDAFFELSTMDITASTRKEQSIPMESYGTLASTPETPDPTETAESKIVVPLSATEENPYKLPVSPIDPSTGIPYDSGSDMMKQYLEAAEVSKKSKTGMVYYDAWGVLQASSPYSSEELATLERGEGIKVGDPTKIDPVVVDPDPVVVEPDPDPVVVEPDPVVVEPDPDPVVVEPDPDPVVVEPDPDPVVVEPDPDPVVVEPDPDPVVVEPDPDPVVVEPDPDPVVVEPDPDPVVVEPDPDPVVVEPDPDPVVVEPDPDPVVVEPDPDPVVEPTVRTTSIDPQSTQEGISYKIQLAAVRNYKAYKFNTAKSYGTLDLEDLPSKGLTRVLLSGYQSEGAARTVLNDIRRKGHSDAFIIKYENGVRVGQGFR